VPWELTLRPSRQMNTVEKLRRELQALDSDKENSSPNVVAQRGGAAERSPAGHRPSGFRVVGPKSRRALKLSDEGPPEAPAAASRSAAVRSVSALQRVLPAPAAPGAVDASPAPAAAHSDAAAYLGQNPPSVPVAPDSPSANAPEARKKQQRQGRQHVEALGQQLAAAHAAVDAERRTSVRAAEERDAARARAAALALELAGERRQRAEEEERSERAEAEAARLRAAGAQLRGALSGALAAASGAQAAAEAAQAEAAAAQAAAQAAAVRGAGEERLLGLVRRAERGWAAAEQREATQRCASAPLRRPAPPPVPPQARDASVRSRRVQLVRRDGRDVSTLYGRGGGR
jgi:hypothetical protein